MIKVLGKEDYLKYAALYKEMLPVGVIVGKKLGNS